MKEINIKEKRPSLEFGIFLIFARVYYFFYILIRGVFFKFLQYIK